MKKIYEKSEIWFAVAWIILYVVVMGDFRDSFGDENIYTTLGLLAIAAALLLFMLKNSLGVKYGLVRTHDSRRLLYFLPMVIPCTLNLWCGVTMHYDLGYQMIAVTNMAIVGFVEELIFRGLLFRAIEKKNVTRAIIISAVTFGAGHIVNLLLGQASLDTMLQIAYSIALGFAFVMMFYRSGSLFPCIIAHAAIDITWKFSNQNLSAQAEAVFNYLGSALVIVVSVGYAAYLYRIRGNIDGNKDNCTTN